MLFKSNQSRKVVNGMPYESDEGDERALHELLKALAVFLGRMFRDHRLSYRMSQADAGERAKLSPDDVSGIERGEPSTVALRALREYANNLGVPEELSVLYRAVGFASKSPQWASTVLSRKGRTNRTGRREISPEFWRSLDAPHP
jgi:transcriptional regulator with XRE-family HTH domain